MDLKQLKVESQKFQRKVCVALEIQRDQTAVQSIGMNKDDGLDVTSGFWKPLIKHINNTKNAMICDIICKYNVFITVIDVFLIGSFCNYL